MSTVVFWKSKGRQSWSYERFALAKPLTDRGNGRGSVGGGVVATTPSSKRTPGTSPKKSKRGRPKKQMKSKPQSKPKTPIKRKNSRRVTFSGVTVSGGNTLAPPTKAVPFQQEHEKTTTAKSLGEPESLDTNVTEYSPNVYKASLQGTDHHGNDEMNENSLFLLERASLSAGRMLVEAAISWHPNREAIERKRKAQLPFIQPRTRRLLWTRA